MRMIAAGAAPLRRARPSTHHGLPPAFSHQVDSGTDTGVAPAKTFRIQSALEFHNCRTGAAPAQRSGTGNGLAGREPGAPAGGDGEFNW